MKTMLFSVLIACASLTASAQRGHVYASARNTPGGYSNSVRYNGGGRNYNSGPNYSYGRAYNYGRNCAPAYNCGPRMMRPRGYCYGRRPMTMGPRYYCSPWRPRRAMIYRPCWGPQFSFTARWVFFPGCNLYWDNWRNNYVFYNGGGWVSQPSLPPNINQQQLNNDKPRELSKDLDDVDDVYVANNPVKEQ